MGAACDGSTLQGLVNGSVWVGDMSTGLYRLASCPAGFEVQANTQDGQQCRPCPSSYYCLGGARPSAPCPASAPFAPVRSASLDACRPAVLVEVVLVLPLPLDELQEEGGRARSVQVPQYILRC